MTSLFRFDDSSGRHCQIPREDGCRASAYQTFSLDNVKYNGSLDRSDLAAFANRVRTVSNWISDDVTAYPLTGNSLFAGEQACREPGASAVSGFRHLHASTQSTVPLVRSSVLISSRSETAVYGTESAWLSSSFARQCQPLSAEV
jgi:hypothetical protein